ncbi:MAG TPA: hypothetical protein VNA16_08420 [Abditibacteriaceae bacterium]|nr:hypothetical protein [Abditibacteriaceae bacterium]
MHPTTIDVLKGKNMRNRRTAGLVLCISVLAALGTVLAGCSQHEKLPPAPAPPLLELKPGELPPSPLPSLPPGVKPSTPSSTSTPAPAK